MLQKPGKLRPDGPLGSYADFTYLPNALKKGILKEDSKLRMGTFLLLNRWDMNAEQISNPLHLNHLNAQQKRMVYCKLNEQTLFCSEIH